MNTSSCEVCFPTDIQGQTILVAFILGVLIVGATHAAVRLKLAYAEHELSLQMIFSALSAGVLLAQYNGMVPLRAITAFGIWIMAGIACSSLIAGLVTEVTRNKNKDKIR